MWILKILKSVHWYFTMFAPSMCQTMNLDIYMRKMAVCQGKQHSPISFWKAFFAGAHSACKIVVEFGYVLLKKCYFQSCASKKILYSISIKLIGKLNICENEIVLFANISALATNVIMGIY